MINDGEVATNKIDVILKLSGSDAVGVTGYNLSTNSDTPSITDSNWESVTSTTRFSKQVSETISAVEKSHSFFAWYRDAVGGTSTQASASIIYDVTAPATPSVSINGGASSTSGTSVTLTLSATDSVGVTGYYASESSTKPALSNSGWKSVSSATSYSGSVSFSLSSGTGTKTLYVWFRDVAGNISDSASDNIMLTEDKTAPTGSISSCSSGLVLSATDSVGVTGYYLSTSSSIPLASSSSWSSVTSTTSFSITITSYSSYRTYYVWYKDAAGNVSSSKSIYVSSSNSDSTDPSGSISLSGSTGSSTVTVSLSATDTCGVTGYYLSKSSSTPSSSSSNWTTITSTTSYSASVNYTITSTIVTLYVWFKDASGNVSSRYSATYYDSGPRLLYSFDDGGVPGHFTMSGNANWAATSSTYSSGTHSLKSGSIVHSQTSCVSVTQTTVAGVYSFYYKTGSDSTDYLKFYIDNSAIITASGSSSSSFTKYSGTVSSAGSHTFKWCYEKDYATSDGSDAVWIDEILMPLEAKTFSSVSAGKNHTCATDNSSSATCWGLGSHGQLGYSSSGARSQLTPISVSGISTATVVSAGRSHTCAVLSGGTVKCWGHGGYGQLGYSSSGTSSQLTPISVSDISTAISVSAVHYHTCAILSGGTLKCWGRGSNGQLGYSSSGTSTQYTPISVSGISTATAVSAGELHTCAVLFGGTVKCWGYGYYGQLGYSSSGTSSQYTPISVSGISTAIAVSAGDSHTCAVLSGGTVKCWGSGGKLGNGSSISQYTPVSVSGISTATAVSAGNNHTCAVLSGGTVKCWGSGDYGQLGNGSSSYQYTPVTVSGISTATAVSAGGSHTCAVLSGGTVKCWGYGGYGQLGNGSSSYQYTPVSVDPLFSDQSGPTGSFAINNKSSYSTGNKTVSFTLTAADSTAIVGYYLSTSSSTPSSSSSSWTTVIETTSLSETVTSSKYLSSGNNNFYVWYKDVLGNISAQYTDSMYCNSSTCY